MLFNSIDFALFLPIVFILYWLVFNKSPRRQNTLIVLASYLFYGWWDWRFLFLILFSTLVDYTVGTLLKGELRQFRRKYLLWVSVIVNLGLLGYFKYYNFFVENFIEAFSFIGVKFHSSSLNIILPVGISFYTFQTLSYTIDVYKRRLEPTKDFIAFTAFVSYFPQLVAGPIERATNLLPQFITKRNFNYYNAVDGLRQIVWGLFKKVVIADNCAEYANLIFNNSDQYPGSVLLIGAVLFSFQIYGDFSGYSDIAIGVSRLFGINLMQNFAFPYFSRDMAEFWRRWHISLSTWFRDYLYIPLGGSKGGMLMKVRNTFIIFLVSGLWHGANWTFVIWGALNAIYFLPLLLKNNNRRYLNQDVIADSSLSLRGVLMIFKTFTLTVIAWIFFRAENVNHAISILGEIASKSILTVPSGKYFNSLNLHPLIILFLLGFFIFIEWKGKSQKHALESFGQKWNKYFRMGFYYLIIFAVFWFGGQEQQFIYFQF